jgi:hypothetical protein
VGFVWKELAADAMAISIEFIVSVSDRPGNAFDLIELESVEHFWGALFSGLAKLKFPRRVMVPHIRV